MNFTKLKYQLQVLINPRLWLRLERTNKTFDKWLWDRMEEGTHKIEPHYYSKHRIFPPSINTVEYAGKEIWTANAPYSDASFGNEGKGLYASRATALRFRRMYQEYLSI